MLEYNTRQTVSQEGNSPELLIDNRFPWTKRKKQTLRLADIYKAAGYGRYAEKARSCSTHLEYYAMWDGQKTLSMANFCNLRLCPLCASRRAKKAAGRLTKVLNVVESEHKGVRFLFLTLTIKNVGKGKLSEAIDQLMTSWDKLMRQRPVKRAVKGWFRALEITYKEGRGYHPHLHAILAVEPDYFNKEAGLYIKQAEWEMKWKKALGVNYKPRVDIRVTKARLQSGKNRNLAAALEAAKYAVKTDRFLSAAASSKNEQDVIDLVVEYTKALYKRRLVAFGGWLKEVAQALKVENLESDDLIHADDDEDKVTVIRADIAELVEIYHWSFGMGDYTLIARILLRQDE